MKSQQHDVIGSKTTFTDLDLWAKVKSCIGQESDPGLTRTANLLLLAGENSTSEPPMLGYYRATSLIEQFCIADWILNSIYPLIVSQYHHCNLQMSKH